MGGGEGGLKERGRNKLLLPRLGGERAYLRGGSYIEDFRYLFEDHKFISAHYNFQVLQSHHNSIPFPILIFKVLASARCTQKSLKLSQFAFNAEGNVPY